jgi:hypothetical protein
MDKNLGGASVATTRAVDYRSVQSPPPKPHIELAHSPRGNSTVRQIVLPRTLVQPGAKGHDIEFFPAQPCNCIVEQAIRSFIANPTIVSSGQPQHRELSVESIRWEYHASNRSTF